MIEFRTARIDHQPAAQLLGKILMGMANNEYIEGIFLQLPGPEFSFCRQYAAVFIEQADSFVHGSRGAGMDTVDMDPLELKVPGV